MITKLFMCIFADYLKNSLLNFALTYRNRKRLKTCSAIYSFIKQKKKKLDNWTSSFKEHA